MGDSLITIIAIFLAAILMFVFPLMSISERNDDIAQLGIQTATVEFVDNVASTGKITLDNYTKFRQQLGATGNSYDVELEVKVLDENPGKKTTWAVPDKFGENVYYSVYTSQIENELGFEYTDKDGQKIEGKNYGTYPLKEGDIFTVSIKNTNTTISQMLRNFFYTVTGKDTYQVAAKHAAMVRSNGN